MHGYVIESWNEPFGEGRGWAPCNGNCRDAVWFVFSTRYNVQGDLLDGSEYASRREAEEAIRNYVADTVA